MGTRGSMELIAELCSLVNLLKIHWCLLYYSLGFVILTMYLLLANDGSGGDYKVNNNKKWCFEWPFCDFVTCNFSISLERALFQVVGNIASGNVST